MKERPILFSAPMVRAILAGRKTQTRRIIKGPQATSANENRPDDHHPISPYRTSLGTWNFVLTATGHGLGDPFPCPYGQPGDQLWVRETWQYANWTEDGYPFIRFQADGVVLLRDSVPSEWNEQIEATWATLSEMDNFIVDSRAADRRWRPSIHMPRWASRINLLIKSIRCEQLQDITEADAKAEGVEPFFSTHPNIGRDQRMTSGELILDCEYRASFACLWDSINDVGAWDKNPWVWVIDYGVMK